MQNPDKPCIFSIFIHSYIIHPTTVLHRSPSAASRCQVDGFALQVLHVGLVDAFVLGHKHQALVPEQFVTFVVVNALYTIGRFPNIRLSHSVLILAQQDIESRTRTFLHLAHHLKLRLWKHYHLANFVADEYRANPIRVASTQMCRYYLASCHISLFFGLLIIELKQLCHTMAFRELAAGLPSVGSHHGAVVLLMGFQKGRSQSNIVVEVG